MQLSGQHAFAKPDRHRHRAFPALAAAPWLRPERFAPAILQRSLDQGFGLTSWRTSFFRSKEHRDRFPDRGRVAGMAIGILVSRRRGGNMACHSAGRVSANRRGPYWARGVTAMRWLAELGRLVRRVSAPGPDRDGCRRRARCRGSGGTGPGPRRAGRSSAAPSP